MTKRKATRTKRPAAKPRTKKPYRQQRDQMVKKAGRLQKRQHLATKIGETFEEMTPVRRARQQQENEIAKLDDQYLKDARGRD